MKKIIIWGVVLSMAMAMGCETNKPANKISFSESDGIFSQQAGKFEVFMLVESQREGNAGILVDADPAVVAQYIPESGFMHSTNVFLVKAPDQTILIDTGFGTTIFEKMKKLGVEPDQVDAVLITHLHGDHFSGLQKDGEALFPKAKIYLSAKELEFFTKTQVNDGAVAALAPYGERVVTFEPASFDSTLEELLPEIYPIAAYGHTPGHTAFLVGNPKILHRSGASSMLIAGDFLHVALVQFPEPDISASYDRDPIAAAAARRQLMDYAAKGGIPIGGMHMVYPAVGTVEAEGTGFKFTPAN